MLWTRNTGLAGTPALRSAVVPDRKNTRLQSQQGGFVLIVVLIVCLGLVSMALLFGHSMMMVYRGSETDIAGRQADRAVEGAVQYASYLMTTVQTPGYLLPDPTLYQSEAVPVGDATFWFIGEPSTTDSTDTPAFSLVDEASKLNINSASAAMLENLPNMTQNLAEAIVAWRKTTSGTGTQSTTSTSSSTGGSTATAKGGPFESIYELAQVCSADGDDLSILYGNDNNLNHVLDAGEDDGSQYSPGIYEYVTVFSREPNTLPDGTKRINVTAGAGALRTLISGTFGETRARQIDRQLRTSGSIRSVVEFYIRSGMTDAEFGQISDQLTMSNGTYATGLVNVNTASAAVLQCIPGITQQTAQQLVSTRTSQATPSTNLAWIVPILGQPAAIQAGPYLTAKTYQVTADVAAVGRNGRGYRRAQFVIDGSTGTPQVVYRHNMASLGWALGPDALANSGTQSLQQKKTP